MDPAMHTTLARQSLFIPGVFLLAGVAVVLGCAASADAPAALGEIVSVAQGELEGRELPSGVLSFKGIPYATPPVGDLRWRAPQPVEAWEDTRPAAVFSPSCWQPLSPEGAFYGEVEVLRDEDCLYLNVWTSADSADAAHPVMVWIHGGGLQTGSGSTVLYDGENFASRGVVLVTINYRLGPMGFLAHPELSAESSPASSGNYGILDQIAALRWINDNIAAFGGDPSRITIFGESAGSWSVNYLTASPLAAGLFQRAIGHSGGIFWPMPELSGDQSAESIGTSLAESHGVDGLAGLRALSAEQIYEQPTQDGANLPFVPNVDGWVFPTDLHTIFATGQQNDVDTIVGFNADEGTALFAPPGPMPVADYQAWLQAEYGEFADEFLAAYPATNADEARVALYENMADRFFAWQMRTWARLQTEHGSKPVWQYFFTRVPPWDRAEEFGSYHAAEILYAFDNFAKSKELREEWGDSGTGAFNHAWEEVDHELARTMSSYWINFATTGDPNGEGLPQWPAYDPSTDQLLELGDTVEVRSEVWKDKLDVFDRYYESLRSAES